MSVEQLVLSALFLLIGFVFWIIKNLIGDVKALKSELDAYKLHVAENFSNKKDMMNLETKMTDGFQKIMDKLEKFEEKFETKLDKKVDK